MPLARWLLIMAIILSPSFAYSLTPKETLDKARSVLSGAGSLSADFSMTADGQTVNGNISSKGNKFSLITNITSNWYNGRELYTYVAENKETTVFLPTSSELAEVNPLLYINSANEFNISGSKNKKNGVETVVLIPKKTGTGIKSIIIDFNSKTFLPKSIKLTPSGGSPMSISISNIKLNPKLSDSQFEYPKDKYKNAKLIDMR